jgi:hypothetical protein
LDIHHDGTVTTKDDRLIGQNVANSAGFRVRCMDGNISGRQREIFDDKSLEHFPILIVATPKPRPHDWARDPSNLPQRRSSSHRHGFLIVRQRRRPAQLKEPSISTRHHQHTQGLLFDPQAAGLQPAIYRHVRARLT